ncbi:Vacuolar transporter chaperone 2 [Venturia inaequalis]|nr:Vacuolar transporter chaperone 2 [Venturia inaequalis]
MFAPPSQSPAEVKAAEEVATQTVYGTLASCVILYLSPFVVDYVKSLV